MPIVLVDVPRRHLAVGDARLDRARPRPHVVVGQSDIGAISPGRWQRHAGALQDRRDVLGEGRRWPMRGLCRTPRPAVTPSPRRSAGRTNLPEPKRPATFIVILLKSRLEAPTRSIWGPALARSVPVEIQVGLCGLARVLSTAKGELMPNLLAGSATLAGGVLAHAHRPGRGGAQARSD